ncbi:MAG: hypothetical protein ACE37F_03600 [Nannocystaceae bacterium]|nr:hypothetical protein [bacterium]
MKIWTNLSTRVLPIVLSTLPLYGCDGLLVPGDDDDDDDDASATSGADLDDDDADENESNGDDDDDHGDESSSESGAPMCSAPETSCEVHGDCPCFDGSMDVGTSLCVGNGESGTCTDVCQTNDDCASGCCGALEGEADYGACAPASICEGSDVNEQCLEGAVFFCACVNAAGVDCSEDHLAAFFDSCADPNSANVEVFECWADFVDDGLDACGVGLEVCDTD